VTFAKTVAQLDRKDFDETLTFGELSNAVDVVTELHGRYSHLVTATVKGQSWPIIQADWRAPFGQVITSAVDEDDGRLDI